MLTFNAPVYFLLCVTLLPSIKTQQKIRPFAFGVQEPWEGVISETLNGQKE